MSAVLSLWLNKKPTQSYLVWAFYSIFMVAAASATIKIPFFFKYAHVSQLLFSLILLNLVTLFAVLFAKKIKLSNVHFLLLFFFFSFAISVRGDLSLIAILALYFITVLLCSSTPIFSKYLPVTLAAVVVVTAVSGLLYHASSKGGFIDLPSARLIGTYGQPNLFAALLMLGLFVYTYLLYATKRNQIIYLIPSLLLATVLFMTASRAAVVALCVCQLVVLFSWRIKDIDSSKKHLLNLLIVLLISYALATIVGDWTPMSRAEASWDTGASTYKRLVYWLSAILIGLDNFWFGSGWNGYAENLGAYAVESAGRLKLTYDMVGQTLWAHNDFLHVFSEHGIFALLLLVMLVLHLLCMCWKDFRRGGVFLLLALLSFVGMMMFSHPLYYHNLALMVSLLVALIIWKHKKSKYIISRKHFVPLLLLAVFFVNVYVVKHCKQMYNLHEFRQYMVTSDVAFDERYKAGKTRFLLNNSENSVYGWEFNYLLYTRLVDVLRKSRDVELAEYVRPEMELFLHENSLPSYLYAMANLYYVLGNYSSAKDFSFQAYNRKPDMDEYFTFMHICNVLNISRENLIPIKKLMPDEQIDEMFERGVFTEVQFDSAGIAL